MPFYVYPNQGAVVVNHDVDPLEVNPSTTDLLTSTIHDNSAQYLMPNIEGVHVAPICL